MLPRASHAVDGMLECHALRLFNSVSQINGQVLMRGGTPTDSLLSQRVRAAQRAIRRLHTSTRMPPPCPSPLHHATTTYNQKNHPEGSSRQAGRAERFHMHPSSFNRPSPPPPPHTHTHTHTLPPPAPKPRTCMMSGSPSRPGSTPLGDGARLVGGCFVLDWMWGVEVSVGSVEAVAGLTLDIDRLIH